MKYNIAIYLLILFAFLIRTVGISTYPSGFTQDEASLGYEAYSILKTGRDSWGEILPLTLRSFGDFKLPLYSYLTIPSVAVFGLNIFSVRLISAIFGTLAVWATYLFSYRLTKRRDIAFYSTLLMAVSPWSVSMSRGAFEANLTTFFIPFALWLFTKGEEDIKYRYFSFLFFGLNLFSYHSARIFTVLVLGVAMFILYRKNYLGKFANFVRSFYKPFFVFLLFFILATYSMFAGASKRGLDVSIFNPTDKWSYVSERRYEAVLLGVPDWLSRIFSNKVLHIVTQSAKTYLSYLSPNFLFTEGAGEWTYGMIAGRGVLYLFEAATISFALFYYIRDPKKYYYVKYLLIWILMSIIPASISKNVGYAANRVAVMMPAIQILSGAGIVFVISFIKKYMRNVGQYSLHYLFVCIIVASFVFFAEDYIFHTPYKQGKSMHYAVEVAVSYISEVEAEYDNVYISRSLSVPNIWIQFYQKTDPDTVQRASLLWLDYERNGKLYLDQLDPYSLGKYIFGTIDVEKIRSSKKRTLILARPEEFSLEPKAMKTVYYKNGEKAYLLVDSFDL